MQSVNSTSVSLGNIGYTHTHTLDGGVVPVLDKVDVERRYKTMKSSIYL